MIRFLILSLNIFYASLAAGQGLKNDLSKIQTISQAEIFIAKNPGANGKIFTIESSKDTSLISSPLYNKKSGFVFNIAENGYKILKVDSTLSFRVNYIFLNGEQFSKPQIDSLRQIVLHEYQQGADFLDLVRMFNMDGNDTGDTGWFSENTMIKGFETAVKDHKKGDIFTVDTPQQNWFHVVLKTYDDTYIKRVTILAAKTTTGKFLD